MTKTLSILALALVLSSVAATAEPSSLGAPSAVAPVVPSSDLLERNIQAELPPKNPWLADTPYPISHHDAAQSDSTIVDGPRIGKELGLEDVKTVPVLWTSAPTYKTVNGETTVIAANPLGIIKIRATGEDFTMISNVPYPGREDVHAEVSDQDIMDVMNDIDERRYKKQDWMLLLNSWYMYWKLNVNLRTMPNGAYSVIDKDGYHYAAYNLHNVVKSFDNNDPNAPLIPVAHNNIVAELPADVAKRADKILGMSMTYDGHLVAAANGVVMVLDRNLKVKSFVSYPGEHIENSIAVDPSGGIYVVTSKRMYKLVWDGETLSRKESDGAWETQYDVMAEGEANAMGAASHGSGTTPSLLGFGPDEERLVVISDGSPDGANLVAFWRDEIPADFEQRAGTKSRRIAAQVPLGFSQTTIEASPVAFDEGIIVVNSTYPEPGPIAMDLISNAFLAGTTREPPRGIKKFVWDKASRNLTLAWELPDIDNTDWMPPAVSATNGLVYIANKRDDRYEYLAADWKTGEIKAVWPFPDKSVRWNTWGGITVFLEDGDFLLGGFFTVKRFNVGDLR